jgi:hypothetical protein
MHLIQVKYEIERELHVHGAVNLQRRFNLAKICLAKDCGAAVVSDRHRRIGFPDKQ